MELRRRRRIIIYGLWLCLAGCDRDREAPLFDLLPPEQTGVTFANTITTTDSLNVQTDLFVYNGAGVAIGDIDNDGLPDIYLTGNMVSSRLYVNTGAMRFEDISDAAGVMTDRWATGATMADIDGNGYLDIYVSVSGPPWSAPAARTNLLFLNNGDRTFHEAAAAYGLDDTGFTTHTVFFDYDRDGDLDAYLLTNSPEEFARGEAERHPAGLRSASTGTYDRLHRNNGDGTFTDVSRDAGILSQLGYGLGIAVSDLNGDDWPDIYISNDITPSDVLYVNNGDGTFTDRSATWLKHTSFAGMGVDIADFNNDGRPDILQTDMMPLDLEARKRMSGAVTHDEFTALRRRGFHYDYNLNTLQLNNGVSGTGNVIFSEIARMAGVAYTDWSWTALFGDYDNDGYKDILITNGYPKAIIDYDYQTTMQGIVRITDREVSRQRALAIMDTLRGIEVSNAIFRNRRDLTFADQTVAWGLDQPGFSYGAAHADLDNDGRLDLVINNIDAPAAIYHNVQPIEPHHHFLQIVLEGDSTNRRGIGAKLILTASGVRQLIEHFPSRGFMSTMDDRIHFGLGAATRVDSLEIVWPNGRRQVLPDLPADQLMTVRYTDAAADHSGTADASSTGDSAGARPLFRPANPEEAIRYEHQQRSRVDYTVQPLLPHMLSHQGPPLAVGDVTGDGLDDVFIGSAAGFPGRLFVQQTGGGFAESVVGQPWAADSAYEDWGALFLDADGDGVLDLYVASGGYHSSPSSDLLQDRLYRNQGSGRFVRDADALPEMRTSTASVTAGDFTGDGRPDLFVGGRLVPRTYPYPTRSYLLRNDGATFTDVTEAVAPSLIEPGGMITDADWVDWNRDGLLDLVTVGTWMPIRFFANDGERLADRTDSVGLPPMRGWWYSVEHGDFNGDGYPDIVAGNLGLNHTFTTSPERRFGVYAADFTGNLTTDIVFTQEIGGTEYPFFGLARLGRSVYTVGLAFETFDAFAAAPVRRVLTADQLAGALHYQVDTFASAYLQNDGDGTFTSAALPSLAQISPIRDILVDDLDADGDLDLLVAGNIYHTDPNVARADAGNGLWLEGDGRGGFTPVAPQESGFLAPLDATGLALVRTTSGAAVLVANNRDSLQVFTIRRR